MRRQTIISTCSLVLLTLLMACVSSGAYAHGRSRTGAISTLNSSASLNPQATGPRGPKGDKGDRGYKGDRGPKGDKGDRGPKGDKGDKGDRGYNGTNGTNGTNGLAGTNGTGSYPLALLPVSLGGPAVGGTSDTTTPPSTTIDGDYTTGWAAKATGAVTASSTPAAPAWIGYDLGAPPTVAPLRYVHMVHIYWGAMSGATPGSPIPTGATVQVQVPNSAGGWTSIGTAAPFGTTAPTESFLRIPTAASFTLSSTVMPSTIRYIQIVVTPPTTADTVLNFTLNEVVVS